MKISSKTFSYLRSRALIIIQFRKVILQMTINRKMICTEQILLDKIPQYLKKVHLLKITHLITARQCLKIKIVIKIFSKFQVLEVIKLTE